MEETRTDQASNAPAESSTPPATVRKLVLSNNQIFSSVLKAAQTVGLLASVLILGRRAISSGAFKEAVTTFGIALFAVSIGLMVLEVFLERALRRCPVCHRYISRNTEEKRRCLECDTELWGYWDE